MTCPLSVPFGRQRKAGGGEQRAVVTQLLSYMRKWLLFPSSLCSMSFSDIELNKTFFCMRGMNGPCKGQIALPAQAGTCLTQYGLVLERHNHRQLCVPPRLAPLLALDTWGHSPYVPGGEGGKCWGSATLCDIQAASVQHLVDEQGL